MSKNISVDSIKELRDKTGVSVMQCKKALEEALGDSEKALIILRKKSGEIAAKKGDRELGSGAIGSYLHSNGTIGAMVVLQSETDFVSKNEDFRKLAYDIAMHVAASNPEYLSLDDIPEGDMKKAREVFEKESEGKSVEMREKIVAGKLDSYFKDKVLLEQSFIKNPDVTIKVLISEAVQRFGERVVISTFTRLKA
ncbi:MAG: elongation factor Ts [Patescibacteria group bacterium]